MTWMKVPPLRVGRNEATLSLSPDPVVRFLDDLLHCRDPWLGPVCWDPFGARARWPLSAATEAWLIRYAAVDRALMRMRAEGDAADRAWLAGLVRSS